MKEAPKKTGYDMPKIDASLEIYDDMDCRPGPLSDPGREAYWERLNSEIMKEIMEDSAVKE